MKPIIQSRPFKPEFYPWWKIHDSFRETTSIQIHISIVRIVHKELKDYKTFEYFQMRYENR